MSDKSSALSKFSPFFVLLAPQKENITGMNFNVQVSPEYFSILLSIWTRDSDMRCGRRSSFSPLVNVDTIVIQLRAQSSGVSRACYSLRLMP